MIAGIDRSYEGRGRLRENSALAPEGQERMPYPILEGQPAARNLLLKKMSSDDYQLLRPSLSPLQLSVRLDVEIRIPR